VIQSVLLFSHHAVYTRKLLVPRGDCAGGRQMTTAGSMAYGPVSGADKRCRQVRTASPLQGLRENGSVVLMGKNTMMKRSIRLYVEETGDEKWSTLVEQLVGNVGLIFTKADLSDVREQIVGFKVCAS
jgi:Ribosomal protein L10